MISRSRPTRVVWFLVWRARRCRAGEETQLAIPEAYRRGPPAPGNGWRRRAFGVSFESLIYRLHSIGLINAEVRDQLRSVGWRGLVNALDSPELQTRLPPEVRKSLVARLGSRPERRPPGWLLERTRAGYEKGTVSIRPLAGLLGADADSLIERPDLVFSGSTEILHEGHLARDDSKGAEDLFQGDPV